MSANSNIEWTDHTFNPWTGCTKISLGCDGCYAEAWSKRAGAKVGKWGPGAPRVRTTPQNWNLPLRWNAQADDFMAQHGRRQRVFCASLADVFDNAVDPAWRADLFALILATPALDWLLLTKRIGNVRSMLPEHVIGGELPSNVWLGATIVNQEEADRDIPKLQDTPAAVRFLSIEPLLGPVSLGNDGKGAFGGISRSSADGEWTYNDHPLNGKRSTKCGEYSVPRIDWVIVGGESGPGARPMHPDWARSLRDQCQAAGVPFLFKQWGEWASVSEVAGPGEHRHFADGATVRRAGKKAAGRTLDGRTWDEVPA